MQNTERQMRVQAYKPKPHEPAAHLIGDTPDVFGAYQRAGRQHLHLATALDRPDRERTRVAYTSGFTRCLLPLHLEQI